MGLPDITTIASDSTFNTWFNTSNDMIDRLNILDISNILVGTGLTLTAPTSGGVVTMSLTETGLLYKNSVKLNVTGTPPTGGITGSAVGLNTAGGYTLSYNGSEDIANRTLGLINSINGSSSYDVTLFGKIEGLAGLNPGSVYYLNNVLGGITTNIPTTAGLTVKPMLLALGTTNGIVLNQRGTLISNTTDYSKSSSRTVATIPVTGITAGNVIYYDAIGSTWGKSKADDYATAEVFGLVESISASNVATVVLAGSINLPAGVTHYIDATGGSGGNDIWFLSGITAGNLQNLAPVVVGNITKPIYYNYAHTTSGVTYTGIVVNYLGYKVEETNSTNFTASSIEVPSEGDVGHVTLSAKTISLGDTAEYMLMDGSIVTTDASIVNGTAATSLANFDALVSSIGTDATSWYAKITISPSTSLSVNTRIYSGWNTVNNVIGTITSVVNSTNYIVKFTNFEKPTGSINITAGNYRVSGTVGTVIAVVIPPFSSTTGVKYYIRVAPINVTNLRIGSNTIASIISTQTTQAADIAALKSWTKIG